MKKRSIIRDSSNVTESICIWWLPFQRFHGRDQARFFLCMVFILFLLINNLFEWLLTWQTNKMSSFPKLLLMSSFYHQLGFSVALIKWEMLFYQSHDGQFEISLYNPISIKVDILNEGHFWWREVSVMRLWDVSSSRLVLDH